MHTHSLSKKARSGWLWGGMEQFSLRGLSMIVSLMLARLLAPDAFGLIATVGVFISIAQQIIDGGIAQRVLQKPDVQDVDYNALFWANIAVSLGSAVILAGAAQSIAAFFGQPDLQSIVYAMAIVLVIMNAGRVQQTKLLRELRFRTNSIIAICGTVIGCVGGITLALLGFGVWALIGQQALAAMSRALLLWMLVPWAPSRSPAWSAIVDLYRFGLPIMSSQVVRTLAEKFIAVVMARTAGPTMLGFYDRGRIIPQNVGYSLGNVFRQANFPVLCRLQDDEQQFRDTYLSFLMVSSALYFMLMAGLFVGARDVIEFLLGERWLPSAWFLQANCLVFSVYVIFSSNAEILRAKGKTAVFFRLNTWCALLQVVGVLVGIPWGAKGMVLGDLVARSIACIPLLYAVARYSAVTPISQLQTLAKSLVGAMVVVVGLVLIQLSIDGLMLRLMLSGALGAGIMGLYWLCMKQFIGLSRSFS